MIQTTTGQKKEIKERIDNGNFLTCRAWDYLEVGDRVRYHAQFTGFPYEVYDKTRLSFLYCVCCRTKNDVAADRCKKCGAPLLK